MLEILSNPAVQLAAIFLLVSTAIAAASLAPWVPTGKKDLKRVNRIADLAPGQTFYEIGCGNGRVCSYIAKKNPEARVIGCELAFPLYALCMMRKAIFGPKNLEIRCKNAFREPFGNTDVIYVFGLERTVNGPIRDKMKREMKPGARFLSYIFPLTTWGDSVFADESDSSPNIIHVYTQG